MVATSPSGPIMAPDTEPHGTWVHPQGESSQPTEQPEAKKPSGGYMVLMLDTSDLTWIELGQFEARSQDAAKREAVSTHSLYPSNDEERVGASEDALTLVAIPLKSWKPTRCTLKVRHQLRFEE